MRYVLIVSLLFLFVAKFYPTEYSKSDFTYDEIQKINPIMVIDYLTLSHPDATKQTESTTFQNMIERDIILSHPLFGNVYNPSMLGTRLNVIIQSGGGLVNEGKFISQVLVTIKSAGYPIDCYVSEAQSMAFFIMVTACDRVIAKPNVKLMQHRAAYGGKNYSPDTYVIDLYMAKKESEALGVDPTEWLNYTRTGEDKVFTLPEIVKYKLVDEYMK